MDEHGMKFESQAPAPVETVNESQKAAFAKAFAKAQAEFETINMDKEATIKYKDKQTNQYRDEKSYRYASLGAMLAATRPALNRNGIALTQDVHTNYQNSENGAGYAEVTAVTKMLFGDYEYLSAPTTIMSSGDTPHEVGSAKTYARRYSLGDALGIAAEEDDDGHGAQGDGAKRYPPAQKQPPAAPAGQRATDRPASGTQQPPKTNPPQTTATGLIEPGKQKYIAQALSKEQIPIAAFNAWLKPAVGVAFIKDIPLTKYDQVKTAIATRPAEILKKGTELLNPPQPEESAQEPQREPGQDDEEPPPDPPPQPTDDKGDLPYR